MRPIFMSVVALVLIIAFVGCATLSMKSKLEKPVSMTNMKGNRVREFDIKQKAIWLFWGLIPMSVPDFDDFVGPHVMDRTGIQELEIKTQYAVLDGLITAVTGGIFTIRTVTIKGEVYD